MNTKTILIILIAMLAVTAMIFQSCKKDEKGIPPTALFTVSPLSGTTNTNFEFDALSSHNEDPISDLQVRWDFDGNGNWDTGWDYNKTENHQYSSANTYQAIVEVMDTEGLTDTYTKSITVSNGCGSLSNLQYGGQTYEIVEIGNQCWMAENLNYETADSWWYENSSANGNVYGRLYTWEAALTACPSGWSLPSDDEWTILSDFLGGANIAGGKMKETGYAHWNLPNTGATNSSGFTALPGGFRHNNGLFHVLGYGGHWWSSNEYSGTHALHRNLHIDYETVRRYEYYKNHGFSIRCLKD